MEHVAEVLYTQPPLLLFPIFLRGVSAQECGPCCGGGSGKQKSSERRAEEGADVAPGAAAGG